MAGHEVLIIRFHRETQLVLMGSTYNLFPWGTCHAEEVQNSRKFTSSNHAQEETYIKAGHLNYVVVKCTPDASHCGGEDSGLARASAIWLVAWNVDDLESSTGYGQAPFLGGRNVNQASFSNQVHVCCDYYLDHAYYFDTGCSDLLY